MDTKWKKYRYSEWLKLFAAMLCIVGMVVVAYGSMKAPYFQYAVQSLESPEAFRNTDSLQLGRDLGQLGIYQILAGKLAFLTGVVYLIYSAGRRRDSEEIHLIWADKIYLDIEAIVIIPAIMMAMIVVYRFWEVLYPVNPQLFYVLSATVVWAGTLLGILFGTSVVKRLKRREVFRHTLIGSLVRWKMGWIRKLWESFNNGLKKGPLAARGAVYFGLFGIALFMAVVFTFLMGAAFELLGLLVGAGVYIAIHVFSLLFVLKKISPIHNITAGAQRIRAGELNFRIASTGEPVTDALIDHINGIAQGLKGSVENEVKAERLKAELVTNVSHDLKTPLTSIITYVDLLKVEGLCSENAPRYLEVLDQKSQRLKSLTEDLFEAAKASSGNLAYSLQRIDITDLIAQGLGELSDRIDASGLEFKVVAPTERILALGDGRLLWRVMENLLSNVFKYALPGSRVYIQAEYQDNWVNITMKNISAFELNIQPDELMERFTRGDESRHSEGSGLGLSIARSLTELQGGRFSIAIDGDLFKVTVAMPKFAEAE